MLTLSFSDYITFNQKRYISHQVGDMASNADKKGFTHLVVLSEKEKECNG